MAKVYYTTSNIENYKKTLELYVYKAGKVAIGGLAEDNQVFQFNEIQLQKAIPFTFPAKAMPTDLAGSKNINDKTF